MSEHPMIEKVARAIYEVTHGKLRSEFSGVLGNPPTFNELVFEADMLLRQEARAAIAAVLDGLKEPSEAAIRSCFESPINDDGGRSLFGIDTPKEVLLHMLAQARAEILGPKE